MPRQSPYPPPHKRLMRATFGMAAVAVLAAAPLARAQGGDVPNCPSARLEVERLWCQGGAAFIEHTPASYAKSIEAYERALDLEKRNRVLGRNAWLVLIDNLGMAYGISGNIAKAREVFEYGVSKEPGYPMFYYNLACAAAEAGDEAKTIDYLKRAFALRANVIPGESMPDPATDDSFGRFMHDAAFVTAIKALPRGAR